MVELQIDFRGVEEWNAWAEKNRQYFHIWRDKCLAEIRNVGIYEPLTNIRRAPNELVINQENLRESISHNGLNSRKRAGLYGLELCLDLLPEKQRKCPRVIAAEALTSAARILGYKFQYFIGTEYIPSPAEQKRHFPIRHLDLQNIDYDASSFDVFYSADVLEHVPHIDKCFEEIFRILKPGGIMVCTFPFLHNKTQNQIRATLNDDGSINHILPPQYHGNPVDPDGGALVYSIPSWAILDNAMRAGFEDAKFTYVVSANYGILNSPHPGVFVFSAVKAPDDGRRNQFIKTRYLRKGGMDFDRPEKLVGLIGLPRSGTTMLASIFSVHPEINGVYEPWNARKNYLVDNVGITNFYNVFSDDFVENKKVLFVKETSTKPIYVQRMKRLLDSANEICSRKVIVLLRNPFHIYLSEIEARVKWWGNPDASISVETFDAWALRSIRSMFRMLLLAEQYNGLLVSYEYVVNNPTECIGELMEYIELPVNQRQFNFQDFMNVGKVRGDPKMSGSPTKVDADRSLARDAEYKKIKESVSGSRYFNDICLVCDYVEKLAAAGPVLFNDFAHKLEISPALYMPIN